MDKGQLASIVTDARNGDVKAQNDLFNEYIGAVYAFALEYVKSSGKAGDVTQDTFIEMINTLGELDDPEGFDAWIAEITCAKCAKRTADGSVPVYEGDEPFREYSVAKVPVEIAETIAICVSLETGVDITSVSTESIINGADIDESFEDVLRSFVGTYDETFDEAHEEDDVVSDSDVLGAIGADIAAETKEEENTAAVVSDEVVLEAVAAMPTREVKGTASIPVSAGAYTGERVTMSPVMTKLLVCSVSAVIALGGVTAAIAGSVGKKDEALTDDTSYSGIIETDETSADTEDVFVTVGDAADVTTAEKETEETETTATEESETSAQTEPDATEESVTTTETEVIVTTTETTTVQTTETVTTTETDTVSETTTTSETETTTESESETETTTTEADPEPPVENNNDFAGEVRFRGFSGVVTSKSEQNLGKYVKYEFELTFMPNGGNIYDNVGNPLAVSVPVMKFGSYFEWVMLSEAEIGDAELNVIKSANAFISSDATADELFSNETYFTGLSGEIIDGVKYIMYKEAVGSGVGYCDYTVLDGGVVEITLNSEYMYDAQPPVKSITVSGDKTRVNVVLSGEADGVTMTMYA